jgi:hypothetical protein
VICELEISLFGLTFMTFYHSCGSLDMTAIYRAGLTNVITLKIVVALDFDRRPIF